MVFGFYVKFEVNEGYTPSSLRTEDTYRVVCINTAQSDYCTPTTSLIGSGSPEVPQDSEYPHHGTPYFRDPGVCGLPEG